MVVELVPIAVIECVGSVMTGAELPLMIWDSEEIVQGSIGRPFSWDHELRHIQAILGEVH